MVAGGVVRSACGCFEASNGISVVCLFDLYLCLCDYALICSV
jgi:hypothetical protein